MNPLLAQLTGGDRRSIGRSAAVPAVEEQEVRCHIAQLFPRLKPGAAERRWAVEILEGYLHDRSRIVRTFSMQALVDIAMQDSRVRGLVVARLKPPARMGSPAMQSRGRRLLAHLSPPVRSARRRRAT